MKFTPIDLCGCCRVESQSENIGCCIQRNRNPPCSNCQYLGFNPHLEVRSRWFVFQKRLRFRNSECTICLEDFYLNENVVLLSCGHSYHKGCIENWLLVKNNCPLCKFIVGKVSNANERTSLLHNV
ncbi:uncharacterized protein LOC136084698 [Hydra vulgaris]|uniref:uncharacterized protein LOC136084698 n=1 Tax=Hydra vulgaris TaxID=6087 RepID=UPI0032E9E501